MFPDNSRVSGEVFERLLTSYSEPHRYYHTVDHLYACFRVLDTHFPDAGPHIRFALWFHDIVYDTHSGENEEKSGEIAMEELDLLGIDGRPVYDLILATKHDAEPEGEEARILVDVDLSILGETDDVYTRYEQNVRQEYAWVPEEVFWSHRKTILKQFMKREWFYLTDPMRQSSYESRAWRNLRACVEQN